MPFDGQDLLPLTATDSSDLEGVGYNPDLEVMDVKFRKSGKTVRYFNVGPLIYEGFMSAKSKGIYFNKFIRRNYVSREIGRA